TRQRQRYRFREAQRKLLKEHARNARRPRDQRQDAEKIVISTSDFQAALGRDKEKVFRPLYNLQVVQDIESPLVLGYEVFAQATDAGTLMPLRKRMCNCMPPIRRTTGRSSGVPSDRSGRSPRANSSGRPRSRSMCARKDIG